MLASTMLATTDVEGDGIHCESQSPQLATQLMREAQKGELPWCSYNLRPRVIPNDHSMPGTNGPGVMAYVEPANHSRKVHFRNLKRDSWHPSGRKSVTTDDRSDAGSEIRYQRETGQVSDPQKNRIGLYSAYTMLDEATPGIPVGTKLFFMRGQALDVPRLTTSDAEATSAMLQDALQNAATMARSLRNELRSLPHGNGSTSQNSSMVAPVIVEQKQAGKAALLTLNRTCAGTEPYVEFSQAGVKRGALVPSSAGVSFCSSSGDFAEWHQQLDPAQVLEEGSVVGLFDGKVSLVTANASMCGVITRRAIIVGSVDSGSDAKGALVAYCGRVPIRVRGPVKAGDALIPSGNGDGIAVRMKTSEAGPDCSDSCPALGDSSTAPAMLAVALKDSDSAGDEWSVSMVETSVVTPGWTPAMRQATYGRPQIRSIARVGTLVCLALLALLLVSMTSHLQMQPMTNDAPAESASTNSELDKTPSASMQFRSAQPDMLQPSAAPSLSTSNSSTNFNYMANFLAKYPGARVVGYPTGGVTASNSKHETPRTSMPSMQPSAAPSLSTSTVASPNSKHEKSSAPSMDFTGHAPLTQPPNQATQAEQARLRAQMRLWWNATSGRPIYKWGQGTHNTSGNANSSLAACDRKAGSALAACKKRIAIKTYFGGNKSSALAACKHNAVIALAACSQQHQQSTGSTVIKAPAVKQYGCNMKPLLGQTSCANCAGLAFIKNFSMCTGCMPDGKNGQPGTKITASNVGSIKPAAILCGTKTRTSEYQCATEYGLCSCNGRVRYGTGKTWSAFKASTGTIACTNAVFGDVLKGVPKVCTCTPRGVHGHHHAVANVSSAHDWFGLVRLKDQTARCMDGSLGAYYVARATAGSVHNSSWLIHLGNGGVCSTKESCAFRLQNFDSSSKRFPAVLDMSTIQPAGLVDHQNELSTWNRVHIPCCSQDLWTGRRATASNKSWGMYFSGHRILAAVLDDLNAQLGAATAIVLSGESAGGIGVWPNVDWLAAKYPRARVVGAPIGGVYFTTSAYREKGPNIDFQKHVWRAHFERWQSFVDTDCALHHKGGQAPWDCILSNRASKYVSSPTFIVESGVDKLQVEEHGNVPNPMYWAIHWVEVRAYLLDWHANMSANLAQSMRSDSPNGVFFPACYMHTTFTRKSPLIGGISFVKAFTNWFYRRTPSTKLADTCGILCNPTCPKSSWGY